MADDDWRVEVELDEERHGGALVDRLRRHDLDDEARDRLKGRVAVTKDGPRVFLYAKTEEQAREARLAFRGDYRLAQFLLNTRPEDARQRQEGEEAARRALDTYGVMDDPRWFEKKPIRALSAEERKQARVEAGELLLMLARVRAVQMASSRSSYSSWSSLPSA